MQYVPRFTLFVSAEMEKK